MAFAEVVDLQTGTTETVPSADTARPPNPLLRQVQNLVLPNIPRPPLMQQPPQPQQRPPPYITGALTPFPPSQQFTPVSPQSLPVPAPKGGVSKGLILGGVALAIGGYLLLKK